MVLGPRTFWITWSRAQAIQPMATVSAMHVWDPQAVKLLQRDVVSYSAAMQGCFSAALGRETLLCVQMCNDKSRHAT